MDLLRLVQFVEKDPKLADPVLRSLLKFWPLTNSQKEVLFIGELEEVLELTQVRGRTRTLLYSAALTPMFSRPYALQGSCIGRCFSSATWRRCWS